jgi:hypothetical protein
MSHVWKKDIVELLDRARTTAKGEAEAGGRGGLPAPPHERLAFDRWLSAYRNRLDEFCSSRTRYAPDEQTNQDRETARR